MSDEENRDNNLRKKEQRDKALLAKYEPVLYFSPGERFFPMDAEDFICDSELRKVYKVGQYLGWVPFLGKYLTRLFSKKLVAHWDPKGSKTRQDHLAGKCKEMKRDFKKAVPYLQYVSRDDIPFRPAAWPLQLLELSLALLLLGIFLEGWIGLRLGGWLAGLVKIDGLVNLPIITTLAGVLILLSCAFALLFVCFFRKPSEKELRRKLYEYLNPATGGEKARPKALSRIKPDVVGDTVKFDEEKENLLRAPQIGRLDAWRTSFESIATLLLFLSAAFASLSIRPSPLPRSVDWYIDLASLLLALTVSIYMLGLSANSRWRARQTGWIVGVLLLALPATFGLAWFLGRLVGIGLDVPAVCRMSLGITFFSVCALLAGDSDVRGLWRRGKRSRRRRLPGLRNLKASLLNLAIGFGVLCLFRTVLIPILRGESLDVWQSVVPVRLCGVLNATLFGYHIVWAFLNRALLLNGLLGGISGLHDRTAKAAAEKYRIYRQEQNIRQGENPSIPYYGRVLRDTGSDFVALQYWFFYAFNDWRTHFNGMDDHEGEWEHIAVYLALDEEKAKEIRAWDESMIDDALVPICVIYSQHISPGPVLRRPWNGPGLEKTKPKVKKREEGPEQCHPVAYVAAGSHAHYYRPGRLDFADALRHGHVERILHRLLLRSSTAYTPSDRVVDQTFFVQLESEDEEWKKKMSKYVARYHPRIVTDPGDLTRDDFYRSVDSYPVEQVEGSPKESMIDKWITLVGIPKNQKTDLPRENANKVLEDDLDGKVKVDFKAIPFKEPSTELEDKLESKVKVDFIKATSSEELGAELEYRVENNLRFVLTDESVNTRDIVEYVAVPFLYEDGRGRVVIGPERIIGEMRVDDAKRPWVKEKYSWECRLLREGEPDWLAFPGRWGKYVFYTAEAGPVGPMAKKEKWYDPVGYAGLVPIRTPRLKDDFLQRLEDALNKGDSGDIVALCAENGKYFPEEKEHVEKDGDASFEGRGTGEDLQSYYKNLVKRFRGYDFVVTPIRSEKGRREFWLEAKKPNGTLVIRRYDTVELVEEADKGPRIKEHVSRFSIDPNGHRETVEGERNAESRY
jgi:hypothetical protein